MEHIKDPYVVSLKDVAYSTSSRDHAEHVK